MIMQRTVIYLNRFYLTISEFRIGMNVLAAINQHNAVARRALWRERILRDRLNPFEYYDDRDFQFNADAYA